ncbi:MAG: hypothetical protein HFE46_05235 [Clostridia bacterium]|jgi:hypothetical protein|nr:hypothetical protein [Clostridia bacterium]
MTYVIDEQEKAKARRTKKRLFWSWFACLTAAVLIVTALTLTAFFLVENYRNRSYTPLFAVAAAFVAIGFACGSLFFFAVKYRLTRKYVRMLRDMDTGLKDTIEARFMGYDDALGMKDGVYFYSMLLKTRPLRRDDIDERKLLIEQTVPKPDLIEGTKLKVVSHANILVAYEVMETPAPAEEKEIQA